MKDEGKKDRVVTSPYPCIPEFGLVLLELLDPEIIDVSKAGSVNNTEGDQENICPVVGQHPDPVKILLPSSVPKTV